MLIVLGCMLTGMALGFLFRKYRLKSIQWIILGLIWLLLLLLGWELGSNDQVVKQFAHLGFEAFLLAAVATLGSVLLAALLWRFSGGKKQLKHADLDL